MTVTTDYIETQLCGTCLCWLANADDSSLDLLPEVEAAEQRATRDRYLDGLDLGDYDDEPHFTHSGCPACSPGLGNDVYDVTLFERP